MGLPVRKDLIATSGADTEFEFGLTDGNGVPVPLDGKTVEMHLSRGSGKVAHTKLTSNSGAHYDADGGLVRFLVSQEIAPANAVTELWWYEVWVKTNATGVRKRHFEGELLIPNTIRIG